MRKHIAELEDVGEFLDDPNPHSVLLYRETPEDWGGENDPSYKKEYIRRSYSKFVFVVYKTKAHPIQGMRGRASYVLQVMVGSHDDRLDIMWGGEIDQQNVGAIPHSRDGDRLKFTQLIPCGEVEHVLEHVREIIDSGMLPAQDLEFQRFLPPTAGETFMGIFWLFLILFALFCCCAGCCCRGVFHYIFCLFLCKKKEEKNEEEEEQKEVKVMTYPTFIAEKQHTATGPRPVSSAIPGAPIMVPEPMLAVEPLMAPPGDIIEPLSPIEIKIEGERVPALNGTLSSSLLDTTTTGTGDSLMTTGNSVQAVGILNRNGSDTDTSSIEISIHENENSISAAVRSGSADLPDSTSNSDVEIAMPENDSSISAAVRNASEG